MDLSNLTFPTEPEATYYDGQMAFEFEVVLGYPASDPPIVDIEGNLNRLTMLDKVDTAQSIKYTLLNPEEGFRTGTHRIRAYTHSKYFQKGPLRLLGTVRIPFGEPVFIRKLYLLA